MGDGVAKRSAGVALTLAVRQLQLIPAHDVEALNLIQSVQASDLGAPFREALFVVDDGVLVLAPPHDLVGGLPHERPEQRSLISMPPCVWQEEKQARHYLVAIGVPSGENLRGPTVPNTRPSLAWPKAPSPGCHPSLPTLLTSTWRKPKNSRLVYIRDK